MSAIDKTRVIHYVWEAPIVDTIFCLVEFQNFVEFGGRLLIEKIMRELIAERHVKKNYFRVPFRQSLIDVVRNAVLRYFSHQ